MWKCIGLLLFFGQWILVTSESNEISATRNTRDTECCPCPEGKSADLTAAGTSHIVDDCPCRARNADSDPAASIFTPIFRAVQPSRQPQQKDLKHLLEPEVDLASSVLETLREATEEEYQEALARNAARNAVQEDINKFVKIVVHPDTDDSDNEPEASNGNRVRCVDPLENNNILGRSSFHYPSMDLSNIAQRPTLVGTHDVPDLENNFQRAATSRNAKYSNSYKRPLQSILKTPVYERDLFVSPTDHLNRYVHEYERLPVTSLLPLGRNSLLKQSDFRNILNLDKISSLVPNEIMNERHVILPDRVHNTPSINPVSVPDGAFAETINSKKCLTDNISNDSESSVETKILNSLPNKINDKIESKSSEKPELDEEDGIVEETHDNLHMFVSPDNEKYNVLPRTLNNEDRQFKTEQFSSQAEHIPLLKESILKTLENFREANTAMHDNLKTSLDKVLEHNSARMASDSDSSNFEESGLNLNVMPTSHIDKDVASKPSNRNAVILNKLDQRNAHTEREPDFSKIKNANADTCLVSGSSQSKNANTDQNEMKMSASEPFDTRYGSEFPNRKSENKAKNALNIRTPMKTIEDINLDIFDYQPFSLDQHSAGNTIESLPRFNMKSYQTKVPIPQSLDVKPVKLQKAFRKGNDVLGAILTINPHSQENSNNMRSSQSKSSHNIFEHPLGMLPSFDDIRSFLEHSAKNILKLPHHSRNVAKKIASPLSNIEDAADNLRTYTEGALKSVQQSLGDTLHNVRDRERTIIGDALLNPNGLVESLTTNNMNDKLHDLQLNLNDRLQNIFDQSRSSSHIQPLNSRYSLNSKNNPAQRKHVDTDKILRNRMFETRLSSRIPTNKENNILHRKLNSKASIPSRKVLENSRANLPTRQMNKPISLDNVRLSKTVDSNHLLRKQTPLTSAKKASILESLTNRKLLLPILERKLANPTLSRNALSERNSLTQNLIREQKSSPSESIYQAVPIEETRKESLPESKGVDKKYRTSALPMQTLLKKTLLPKTVGNHFVSKVKEGMAKNNLRNSNVDVQNDAVPSPSEIIKSAEPQKENLAFNCKMVCDKA